MSYPVFARYVEFQPGNGTRYDLTLVPDRHGGCNVVWPSQATYRWYPGDYLKFLHGKKNEFDRLAIFDYLEANITTTIGEGF